MGARSDHDSYEGVNRMKACSKCGTEKPLVEYVKQAASRDGKHPWCKDCRREYQRNNPKNGKYREKWLRGAGRGYMERYQQRNKSRYSEAAARYRAAKLQRTVSWADPVAIDFVYFCADVIINVYGGEKPHVDHVIPLQGALVSGLHVENNLKLLSASDNKSKGNRT